MEFDDFSKERLKELIFEETVRFHNQVSADEPM
jgi:hypothetical protein